MILWSKTKAEIPEPKNVALIKLPKNHIQSSDKDRIESFRATLRRRWAEANPILYAGFLSNHEFGKRKRTKKVQDIFYRTLNWGRFSRFLKHSSKERIISRLVHLSSVKVPFVASYSSRRKKNRDIKISGPCVACGCKADVVHHIIMVINGGPNIRRNTVPLCNGCHAEVHPWLKTKKETV